MGLVQHYFATKDQMMLFAFRTIGDRFERRIGEAVAALPQPYTTRSVLRAMLGEMLLSEDARVGAPIWISFMSRAMVAPALAAELRVSGGKLRAFVRDRLQDAQRAGDIPPGLDPNLETATLLGLVDGLMLHALIEPDLAETALATLDYHLDRIFGG